MNRDEAIDVLARLRGAAAIVVGPGANSGLMFARCDAPASIYNMDMGYAAPVALGIALARPARRVIAIEGDGSFYAGSTVLSTVCRVNPENLTIVVLDNGVWGTGDGTEPTATSCGLNLGRLAVAAGWSEGRVSEVDDTETFQSMVATSLTSAGPYFIVAKTDPSRDQFLSSTSRRTLPPIRHMLDCAVLTRLDLVGDD